MNFVQSNLKHSLSVEQMFALFSLKLNFIHLFKKAYREPAW